MVWAPRSLSQALDIHDTIGYDLVGMVVDDIVVRGVKPLFMTDYIAAGKVVPERIANIVRGIAGACAQAGTALVGGETAEHPACSQRTSTTLRAQQPVWLRQTNCSAPSACVRRRTDCYGVLRYSFQRLLPGP